jgi:hypothetical protein
VAVVDDQYRYVYIMADIIYRFTIDPVFQPGVTVTAQYQEVGFMLIYDTNDFLGPA